MKLSRLAVLPVLLLVLLVSASAFAQDVAPVANLTPVSGAALIVALLIGFFGNVVATGKIFGQYNVPPKLIPVFTLGGAYLVGAAPVLKAASSFSGTVIFNAIAMGFAGLIAASAGIVAHNHIQDANDLPKVKEMLKAAAKVAAAVLFIVSFAATQVACAAVPVIVPPIADCTVAILDDAVKGMTIAQIVADVQPKCGADVLAIVQALLGSAKTEVVASKAYKEAVQLKAALAPVAASSTPAPSAAPASSK